MSPLLFNIAIYALFFLITKAQIDGILVQMETHQRLGGIAIPQYVVGTLSPPEDGQESYIKLNLFHVYLRKCVTLLSIWKAKCRLRRSLVVEMG